MDKQAMKASEQASKQANKNEQTNKQTNKQSSRDGMTYDTLKDIIAHKNKQKQPKTNQKNKQNYNGMGNWSKQKTPTWTLLLQRAEPVQTTYKTRCLPQGTNRKKFNCDYVYRYVKLRTQNQMPFTTAFEAY